VENHAKLWKAIFAAIGEVTASACDGRGSTLNSASGLGGGEKHTSVENFRDLWGVLCGKLSIVLIAPV
jgi:hypothetical protein